MSLFLVWHVRIETQIVPLKYSTTCSSYVKKLMYIISLAVGLFDVGMTNSSFVIDGVSP